jgi:uncharacterized protein with NAD-binding domain and iron-sulfur cluster
LRGTLRMFLTYRGSFFWRMQAGMGDVVFAPFYEVLKRRGVTFQFFHRLENLRLSDSAKLAPGERPFVEALEFDVQAVTIDGSEYQPLIDVRGLPCWSSRPDYAQLAEGDRIARERWDFESHWDHRKAETRTLHIGEDFDFVVLGVGLGAIPYVAGDLLARDQRWRDLVSHVPTVATQAFQIWMREDMAALGWHHRQTAVSAFSHPFDTWADMRHLIFEENWLVRPRAIAYFCGVLADGLGIDQRAPDYPVRQREQVRRNAMDFLDREIRHLWPASSRMDGGFRWDLLVVTDESSQNEAYLFPGAGEAVANSGGRRSDREQERFNSQFWTANANPSDRYVQSPPKTTRFRISPLDNTYDNLTIAGDWTACGLNVGCVEAAVISGRLAAHALCGSPALEEIVGYDHP